MTVVLDLHSYENPINLVINSISLILLYYQLFENMEMFISDLLSFYIRTINSHIKQNISLGSDVSVHGQVYLHKQSNIYPTTHFKTSGGMLRCGYWCGVLCSRQEYFCFTSRLGGTSSSRFDLSYSLCFGIVLVLFCWQCFTSSVMFEGFMDPFNLLLCPVLPQHYQTRSEAGDLFGRTLH